jgi:UDP-2,3-diacylglucosamine hydrolase
MDTRPVYIASDVHLGSVPESQAEAFFAWLEHTPDSASRLVLNGDLFDFWYEFRWGIPSGQERILGLLKALVDSGLPVTLMGGNHDWWGGRYLREEIGLEFLQDPVVRDYAGYRTFLAHGDGLGAGDLGYRVLRWVLRGRPTRLAFGVLPPRVGCAVARRVSQTEEHWGGPTDVDRGRSEALEAWAVAKLREEPDLDLVLLGHTHIPLIRQVGPERWYVNAGDWVFHRTYVTLEAGAPPRLLNWGG